MAAHDIIVVGASAGGVDALLQVARGLPAGLPAAVFVVCHVPSGAKSALPEVLSRAGHLLASHARDGEPFYPGHVYVAPPDHHLLVEARVVRLSRAPRENLHRPAIDPLFRSAARAFGKRVIGVILSGGLHDGVAGLLAVRGAGGLAVVQDPDDAIIAAMPQNARDVAGADYVAGAAALAPLLVELVSRTAESDGGVAVTDPMEKLPGRMTADFAAQVRGDNRGNGTVFSCPECGGHLWQVDEQDLLRFRCHVGHGYYGPALLDEQSQTLEAALWTAVRTFREQVVLARQLAANERHRGHEATATQFEERAVLAERYSELIKTHVLRVPESPADAAEPATGAEPALPPQGTG